MQSFSVQERGGSFIVEERSNFFAVTQHLIVMKIILHNNKIDMALYSVS